MSSKTPTETLSGQPFQPSTSKRARVQGSFISLHDAIETVGSHIAIPNEVADAFRSPNEAISDNPFHETALRASIKSVLQRSRAAGKLRILLTGLSPHQPRWFEVVAGIPIPDEQVRRGGLELLMQEERREHCSMQMARGQGVDVVSLTAPVLERLTDPYSQIGFDVEELARFLNAEGVAHNLQRLFSNSADIGSSEGDRQRAKGFTAQVVVNTVSKAGQPARLYKEIKEAQRRAGDHRYDTDVVWGHLVSMIGEKEYPRLRRLEDDQTLFYCVVPPHGREHPYRKRSLREYIDPDKKMKRDARKTKHEAKKNAAPAAGQTKTSRAR